MNKSKLFLENFVVYGIGGVISKAIPLIMIPIITALMPSTECFGISDTLNVINSFGCALALMGMYDAMFRMFFEKSEEDYKKRVCSTTFVFTLILSLVVTITIIIFRSFLADTFHKNISYSYLLIIAALGIFVGSTNSIVSAPTRMQNKRGTFLIANTITPLLSYTIALILLVKGYYLIALAGIDKKIIWEHFGDGPLKDDLMDAARDLPDNIELIMHGKVNHDQMLDRFRSGMDHILINTSCSEGIPVSIMEAYSAGLPVIAYDVGGMREIIKSELSEYLIDDVEDVDKFRSKIDKIHNMSQDEYAALCASCNRIWREEYDSDTNYHAFAEELASLS